MTAQPSPAEADPAASGAPAAAPPAGGLTRHAGFVRYWLSRVLSALGYQIAAVAIGWHVYAKTESAYHLGLIGLVQFVPMVLLTFVVGQVADRFDRRRIVVICQAIQAVTLAAVTIGVIADWLSIPMIFAAVALLSAARSFEHPTFSALLPALLPAELLARALAISSSAMQTATIIGPSAGGLLYVFGAGLPLALGALFFAAAAAMTGLIRVERLPPSREPVTVHSVFSGVLFIRSRPLILGTLSLDLFAVLLGGITALLPIFARDILATGPWGLGLLRSAPAVGAIAMSIVLMHMPMQRHVGLKMFAAVIVFGLGTIVFAMSTHLVLSLAALAVMGAADNVSVVIRNALVLLSTPDEMRGRVNAVNSLFIGTSNQLGDFESGMVAGLVGAVPAGIIGGVGTVLVALLWMRLFPAVRRAQTLSG
ncbi:MFS transporter [Phreatobacter sp. AB_2022a]|uniref:MFS transporter n=1 Tax=Phreatobacter sp. AB_2022a TaxID=3003134 RepID=UPI0022873844|nr:MFS transporter [Phreatobacter sp. AB_2022a]MCZ0732729.1 MFS transporter [Phreatobacter sp. AB_2022a]